MSKLIYTDLLVAKRLSNGKDIVKMSDISSEILLTEGEVLVTDLICCNRISDGENTFTVKQLADTLNEPKDNLIDVDEIMLSFNHTSHRMKKYTPTENCTAFDLLGEVTGYDFTVFVAVVTEDDISGFKAWYMKWYRISKDNYKTTEIDVNSSGFVLITQIVCNQDTTEDSFAISFLQNNEFRHVFCVLAPQDQYEYELPLIEEGVGYFRFNWS